MNKRGSGILLHISSLPSDWGVGDLGPAAYEFIDFLKSSGQRYWQILPLNPTGTAYGNAPYSSFSAFAGNALLLSLDVLIQVGLLTKADLQPHPPFHRHRVDYKAAIRWKGKVLKLAFERAKERLKSDTDFDKFRVENEYWLEDYALFAAIRERFNEAPWNEWPVELRDRDPEAIKKCKVDFADRMQMSRFFQYLFWRQWLALRHYANQNKIQLIGDIPIYVSHDSSDVWSHPELFKLAENRTPLFISGAPPDYFSKTGQRWGNPVYRWDILQETKFEWWVQRVQQNARLFDTARLDHFRGFIAYWEIPAEEETAVNGKWVEAPGEELFEILTKRFPKFPLIAEDLGFITEDVLKVKAHFQFPGMKILEFAFTADLPVNPYAPHNFEQDCIVYTGTHDNNTLLGWIQKEAKPEDKQRLAQYLGRDTLENANWDMIRLAMTSVANTVILPLQDVLGLGEEARMNMPSRSKGNWEWRYTKDQLTPDLAKKLAALTKLTGRI